MQIDRRKALAAASTAFTTSIFTGRVKGANDRISMGFIGIGMQGSGNLGNALAAKDLAQVVAVCDVYQPALERAAAMVRTNSGSAPKEYKDFRQVLADKSIDAVCISTPDHWHALMTVEACKAGKDVYVEKPACVHIDEGPKMIQAARKYNRVVQGGNMQRSMPTFRKALEWVQSGVLGEITWAKVWAASLASKAGRGKPENANPPSDLDWDMWLGPAPKIPFNQNRWGVGGRGFPTFRYFYDYAGGAMTDWGIHYIDPVHQCLGEPLVKAVVSLGGRMWTEDNMETADTMAASFEYPKFMMNYELRESSPVPLLGQGGGTAILGTDAYVVVTRAGAWLNPSRDPRQMFGPQAQPPKPSVEPQEFRVSQGGWGAPVGAAKPPAAGGQSPAQPPAQQPPAQGQQPGAGGPGGQQNLAAQMTRIPQAASDHWKNFLECIRTRQRPVADIEYLVRSTASCLLANVSLRAKVRCDIDENYVVKQPEARPFTRYSYRAPWKLEV
jgi:predicted dehydrogenase